MDIDVRLATYLLVILNPFSQVLFLWGLMNEKPWREFMAIYGRASLLSFGVYSLFALTGDYLFADVFQVRIESLRIFGGILILLVAIRYFTVGEASSQFFRGDPTEIASTISLPFMIGPATVWLSILIGQSLRFPFDLVHIAAVLAANFLIVCLMQRFAFTLERNRTSLLGAYLAILMRTNAMFIGGIGVEMVVRGLEEMGLPITNR